MHLYLLTRMRRLGMQGLLLGVLLFFGAPAGESFIVNVLHLWHYGAPLSHLPSKWHGIPFAYVYLLLCNRV